MRAETVRALKRKFGKRFIGGLADEELARSRYPELIADGTSKRACLQSLRRCAVAVTTIGLHESTGHKLAQYPAASRCVVTEGLAHDLP